MDRIVYDRMAEFDATHWWYRGRRAVLNAVIRRHMTLPATANILEIGCGTGHNLAMLCQFGSVDAVEIDPTARAIATQRLGRQVINTPLPEIPLIDRGHYNLIGLFDVLEHIDDDVAALKHIGECLAEEGKLLVTVPAFPWMWSAHDVINHHHRRYTKAVLRDAVSKAGLRIDKLSWFNSVLFVPAVAARFWGKVTRKNDSDDAQPSPAINTLFEKLFALEQHFVGRVPMPPGVSLIAIVSRP